MFIIRATRRRKSKSQRTVHGKNRLGSQIVEFCLIPLILFFLAVPIIDLACLGLSYAYLAYSALACVNKAAISSTYADALCGMESQATTQFNSPLAALLKLSPHNGYKGTGSDLYVVTTNIESNLSKHVGPNLPLPEVPDSSNTTTEYEVDATCTVEPMIALSGINLLKDIPILGTSTVLHYKWERVAEVTSSVATSGAGDSQVTNGGTSSISLNVPGIEQLNLLTKFNGQDWRNPSIYSEIIDSNGNIKDEDVITVLALQNDWQKTSFFIYPTYRIWIDYQAEGNWRFGNDQPLTNANGEHLHREGDALVSNGVPGDTGFMMVKFGDAAPMRVGMAKNFKPNGSGILQLMPYDKDGEMDLTTGVVAKKEAYADNKGKMRVRVVIVDEGI